MSEKISFQKEQYPLPVYNFRVTVSGTTVSFSEVSGITLEYEFVTYKHGFSFWEGERFKKYYDKKFIPVTLKKGIVKGYFFRMDTGTRKQCETHGH